MQIDSRRIATRTLRHVRLAVDAKTARDVGETLNVSKMFPDRNLRLFETGVGFRQKEIL